MSESVIPSEYLAPKWQAYVTPHSRNFVFSNGVSVGSMWQLKQALLQLPEDIILEHLDKSKNDIADWIERIVGDEELASEFRRYNHRWGLVVALERQMMRTLFLPHYVAKRWMSKVEIKFVFESGQEIDSLESLKEVLGQVEDRVIQFHCERQPNDVAVWVADIIGDYELADMLGETNSRNSMQSMVTDHLEMLQEAVLEC